MKNRKLLSALLAVSMLLTVFSATGMSAAAATTTAPADGYIMNETIAVDTVWNKTTGADISSGNGKYATVSVSSEKDSTNQPTALSFTITDVDTMRKNGRLSFSLGAHGNVLNNEVLKDMEKVWVSFDLTANGFTDSELRLEFKGKNLSTGATTGTNPYFDVGFSVDLTDGTQHICVPFSSFAQFQNLGDSSAWITGGYTAISGIYIIFGSNHYSEGCNDATFTISNFDLVNVSYAPEKAETEKVLTGEHSLTISPYYAAQEGYTSQYLTQESISYNGKAGYKYTVTNAEMYNKNNTALTWKLNESADLTDDWENASLRMYARFTGTLASLDVRFRTMIVTPNSKTRYHDIAFLSNSYVTAQQDGWYCFDMPLTAFDNNNVLLRDAVESLVITVVNGADNSRVSGANNDTLEIAGFEIYKTVEAPVNSAAIDLKFSSVSLALEDNLTMNFKADKALFDSKYSTPYAVIEGETVEGVLVGDKYVFSYENIAPQSIRDTVTATLYATYNGAVCEGKTTEYSIKKYCDTLLASTEDAATRTLLVDLLNYGSAAQSYVGKRVNNLANRNLTEEQVAWGTAEAAEVASYYQKGDETGKSVTWESVGLTLDDSVVVNFQFTAASKENLTVKITDGTDTLAELTGDDIVAVDEDSFRIGFDGLNAKGMRRLLYVTVQSGEEAVSSEVVYSVESYVTRVLSEDVMGDATADANLDALVTALMKYGDAAYAYAAR